MPTSRPNVPVQVPTASDHSIIPAPTYGSTPTHISVSTPQSPASLPKSLRASLLPFLSPSTVLSNARAAKRLHSFATIFSSTASLNNLRLYSHASVFFAAGHLTPIVLPNARKRDRKNGRLLQGYLFDMLCHAAERARTSDNEAINQKGFTRSLLQMNGDARDMYTAFSMHVLGTTSTVRDALFTQLTQDDRVVTREESLNVNASAHASRNRDNNLEPHRELNTKDNISAFLNPIAHPNPNRNTEIDIDNVDSNQTLLPFTPSKLTDLSKAGALAGDLLTSPPDETFTFAANDDLLREARVELNTCLEHIIQLKSNTLHSGSATGRSTSRVLPTKHHITAANLATHFFTGGAGSGPQVLFRLLEQVWKTTRAELPNKFQEHLRAVGRDKEIEDLVPVFRKLVVDVVQRLADAFPAMSTAVGHEGDMELYCTRLQARPEMFGEPEPKNKKRKRCNEKSRACRKEKGEAYEEEADGQNTILDEERPMHISGKMGSEVGHEYKSNNTDRATSHNRRVSNRDFPTVYPRTAANLILETHTSVIRTPLEEEEEGEEEEEKEEELLEQYMPLRKRFCMRSFK